MEGYRYLGIGLYTMADGARILNVPVQKLRRWSQGYRFGEGRSSEPLFKREFSELIDRGVLTFLDLMELSMVVQFRQKNVPMREIRATAKRAAEQFQTDHPFVNRKFRTDGKRLFVAMQEERGEPSSYQEIARSQFVFDNFITPFFKKLDYADDIVQAYWPLGKDHLVVLNPGRAFGQPTDPKSGVPARVLYEMHQGGQSLETVADWFEVEPQAVRHAVEYEQSLLLAA